MKYVIALLIAAVIAMEVMSTFYPREFPEHATPQELNQGFLDY